MAAGGAEVGPESWISLQRGEGLACFGGPSPASWGDRQPQDRDGNGVTLLRMLRLHCFLIAPILLTAQAGHTDVEGAKRVFESWIRGQVAYRQLPGVAVGVVSDQGLVWAKGFGFADVDSKRPVTASTKFRMASHSKLFTATAIMQLREQGKVRLDDPVSKYLPWFKVKPAEADDPPITIEELLTHSSGLSREAGSH